MLSCFRAHDTRSAQALPGFLPAVAKPHDLFGLAFVPVATTSKTSTATSPYVPTFEDLLAELLEEPEEVLGILSDVVNRGRLQADDLPTDAVHTLSEYDLVSFLIQRSPRSRLRTWVYPSPLGLRVFAFLEREAEREAAREAESQPRARKRTGRRGKTGARR